MADVPEEAGPRNLTVKQRIRQHLDCLYRMSGSTLFLIGLAGASFATTLSVLGARKYIPYYWFILGICFLFPAVIIPAIIHTMVRSEARKRRGEEEDEAPSGEVGIPLAVFLQNPIYGSIYDLQEMEFENAEAGLSPTDSPTTPVASCSGVATTSNEPARESVTEVEIHREYLSSSESDRPDQEQESCSPKSPEKEILNGADEDISSKSSTERDTQQQKSPTS